MENVLLLGNGLNLNLYGNRVPDWAQLFQDDDKKPLLRNYTFLYEKCLLKSRKQDNEFKQSIVNSFIDVIKPDNIDNAREKGVFEFGQKLEESKISDVLTTNVDFGIESILKEVNGFKESEDKWVSEKIYSIRRKKQFYNDEYKVNVWKIHGDAEKIETVSLGFDQYCGSLSKIESYVKGTYKIKDKQAEELHKNKDKEKQVLSIKNKFEKNSFDEISWIELFFRKNIYIACLGMDLSEIDLWWILNKRKRFIEDGVKINNKITFLYSEYDTGERKENKAEKAVKEQDFKEKLIMFDAFGVETKRIPGDNTMLTSVFEQIS